MFFAVRSFESALPPPPESGASFSLGKMKKKGKPSRGGAESKRRQKLLFGRVLFCNAAPVELLADVSMDPSGKCLLLLS